MKKTLKGKVALGVLTVGVVGGIGTAFAAVDAGEQLQKWYDARYGHVTENLQGIMIDYTTGELNELAGEVNAQRDTAKGNIDTEGNNAETNAENTINASKDGYVGQINTKQSEIEAGMGGQFDQFIGDTNTGLSDTLIDPMADDLENNAETGFRAVLQNQQNQSMTDLNQAIADDESAAMTALRDEIRQTKEDLNKLLAAERKAARGEITEYVDDEIAAKKKDLIDKINKLEEDYKKALNDRQAELTKKATNKLDRIAENIFKLDNDDVIAE